MGLLERPVIVTEISEDGRIRQRWVFVFQSPWLVLERYYYETRDRVGQDYTLAQFYDRHQGNESYGNWVWLTEDLVPWDEDLQNQALVELVREIEVVKQSDLP